MLMNRGFTLIELLAVIVILAIIAVIATPIFLSVIDNAKESSLLRSAEKYLAEVEKSVMEQNIDEEDVFNPNKCKIINASIECDGSQAIDVEMDGEVPVSGFIKFKNAKIIKVKLVYSNRIIVMNLNGELVFLNNTLESLCNLADGSPNTIGAKYTCDLGSGNRNFYVLKEGTDEADITLILDGNYDTETVTWCNSSGPNPNNNVCGADGLTLKLEEIANEWTKLEKNQIGIPSASDIAIADGKNEDAYLNTLKLTNKWLYNWNNPAYGSSVNGYWTSSSCVGVSYSAYDVNSSGYISSRGVNDGVSRGVRPVIYLSL